MDINFRQIFLPKTTVEEILKRPPHQRLSGEDVAAVLIAVQQEGSVPDSLDVLVPLNFALDDLKDWLEVLRGETSMNLGLAERVNRVFMMAVGWPLEKYSV